MINLDLIHAKSSFSKEALALELFPTHTFPVKAFERVARGEGDLNSSQIIHLAEFLGVTVSEIFDEIPWQRKAKRNVLIFSHKEARVELNTLTWTTKIFLNGQMAYEEAIIKRSLSIERYLKEVNLIIQKLKNGKSNN